jgi:emp24/gp25L/p24 family/GOLD
LFSQVLSYQALFRQNEAIGSEAAVELGRRVMWWSLIQAVVIVITGFGQVLAMKLFFTDQREMTVIAVDMGHATFVPFGHIPIRP